MSAATELSELFRRDLSRLLQELNAFPDDGALWRTLPGIANPAGNLTLHLEGNLREFIGRQLGGVAYERRRDAEFSTRDVAKQELLQRIEAVAALVPPIVAGLSSESLEAMYPAVVLEKPITTRHFLMHLQGHLSYHLGQIDYLRRIVTGSGAVQLAGL